MPVRIVRYLIIISILLVIISACSDGRAEGDGQAVQPAPEEQSTVSQTQVEPPRQENGFSRRTADRGPDGILNNPGIPSVEFHKKFDTDFGRSAVFFDSIIPGGPPRDGIPSLSDPGLTDVATAAQWVEDKEPVLLLNYNGTVRVYPVQVLMWHEIVNDTIDGEPVGVSYAPLTNTAIAFHRKNFDTVLTFGTTGRIRFSNPVMYDRQTESWWQQATGKGIVGTYAGDQLQLLPVSILPWSEVERNFPQAEVLSRDTGYDWPYGTNAYEGYDTSDGPFLYVGPELTPQYELFERVLAVRVADEIRPFSYKQMWDEKVLTEQVGGREIALFWQAGTASAVDASAVAIGRDVGSANAYFPQINDRSLTFFHDGQEIRDRETGSTWSLSGVALEGELEGSRLESPISFQHFGYSWFAFKNEY